MSASRPLEGIRVLDFSWVWSGPLVAGVLAEFGAEVIKIEHGERLDNSRLRGKPLRDGRPVEGPSIETGPYFHQTNHDKLSITLNLKAPQARPLLHRLAAVSHVVVENLSPGALARAGMGYEQVAAVNPGIVYLSMSAAGQSGPSSGMRAYAPIMSSYCGFEALVGYPDEPPIGMMNFGYGDPNAAVHAMVPLLAALLEAEETGRGQQIDMSQIEALLSVAAEPLIDHAMNRRERAPSGNRHPAMAPHGIYPAAGDDAWVSIAVADDAQWNALLDAMGRPAGCDRADWRMNEQRLAQREAIDAQLAAWTSSRPAAELMATLRARGIACSPVLDVPGQWADPHYQARGIRQKVSHPISGDEWLYRTPWRMERHPPQLRRSAPLLGQHNQQVFGNLLGLADPEIEALKQAGVIA